MANTAYPKISIIIATLGGGSLLETINSLNEGSLKPDEILICIPEDCACRVDGWVVENVNIIKTACRGQVAQRAIGLKLAVNPLVLQLDDDIIFNVNTLSELAVEMVRLGRGNVVAPLFFDKQTGRCLHTLQGGVVGWLKAVIDFYIFGAPWKHKRSGAITKTALAYGVDSNLCGSNAVETEWLPGGCVMSYSEDLIRHNFFPFSGKAYGEDLIHSYLRKQNGIQHYVVPRASCNTVMIGSIDDKSSIKSEMRAYRYYVKISGEAEWRLKMLMCLKQTQRIKFIINNKLK